MSESSTRAGRPPLARHGQLRTSNPVKQLFAMIGIAMSVVLVAGVAAVAYVGYDLFSTFASDAVDLDDGAAPPGIAALDDGGVNILLGGLDVCERDYAEIMGNRCAGMTYGEDGREAGAARTDVLMLLHISPEPRRVTVVSFPRDLMTYLGECRDEDGVVRGGGYTMINAAYSVGGLGCAVDTVENLTGVDVQHAAAVTWGGVIEITNAIGGVEVCVAEPIRDPEAGISLDAGDHTLSGDRALAFLRTRKGVSDGSDLGRISNQQVYLSALVNKLMSEDVLGSLGTLYSLARTTVNNIEPSTGLTNPVYLAQLAFAARDVPIEDFVFVQYPVYEDPTNSNRVISDTASANALFAALEANVPLTVTAHGDGSVAQEEAESGGEQTDDAQPAEDAEPTEEPTIDPAEPDEQATPAPDPGQLGSNVRGQSAAETRCSAGNGG